MLFDANATPTTHVFQCYLQQSPFTRDKMCAHACQRQHTTECAVFYSDELIFCRCDVYAAAYQGRVEVPDFASIETPFPIATDIVDTATCARALLQTKGLRCCQSRKWTTTHCVGALFARYFGPCHRRRACCWWWACQTRTIFTRELIQHPRLVQLTKEYTHIMQLAPSPCSNLLVRCIYSSQRGNGGKSRLCTRGNSLYHHNRGRRHRYMRWGLAANKRPALLPALKIQYHTVWRSNAYSLFFSTLLEPRGTWDPYWWLAKYPISTYPHWRISRSKTSHSCCLLATHPNSRCRH